jgi:hypothetical protein
MATEKARIDERYRSAVNTSNLGSDPKTFRSDSDVLGAYGLAGRHLESGWVPTGPEEGFPIPPSPLSVPLERLFSGDGNAAADIVRILGAMAWRRARGLEVRMTRVQAEDLARACLAWHRHGTCKPCGGRAYTLIPGTVSLSDATCETCHGTGKVPFEQTIDGSRRPTALQDLARWVVGEIERAQGRAGERAMAALAPRLDL